jgi:hypothetical protein
MSARCSSPLLPTWLRTSLNHRCQGQQDANTNAYHIVFGRCSGAAILTPGCSYGRHQRLAYQPVNLASATSPLGLVQKASFHLRLGAYAEASIRVLLVRGWPRSGPQHRRVSIFATHGLRLLSPTLASCYI